MNSCSPVLYVCVTHRESQLEDALEENDLVSTMSAFSSELCWNIVLKND